MQATRLYAGASAYVWSCIAVGWYGPATLRDDRGRITEADERTLWIDVTGLFKGIHVGLSLTFADVDGKLRVGVVSARLLVNGRPVLELEGGWVVGQSTQTPWTRFEEISE